MENAAIDHISLLTALTPDGSAVCLVTKVVGIALLVHAVAKGRFLFSRFLRRQFLSLVTPFISPGEMQLLTSRSWQLTAVPAWL